VLGRISLLVSYTGEGKEMSIVEDAKNIIGENSYTGNTWGTAVAKALLEAIALIQDDIHDEELDEKYRQCKFCGAFSWDGNYEHEDGCKAAAFLRRMEK